MRRVSLPLFLSLLMGASIVCLAAGQSDVADAAMGGDRAAVRKLLDQHAIR